MNNKIREMIEEWGGIEQNNNFNTKSFKIIQYYCKKIKDSQKYKRVLHLNHGPAGIGDGVFDGVVPVALAINFTKSSVLFDSTSILCSLACLHSRRFSISAARWLSEELARDKLSLPSSVEPFQLLSNAEAARSARISAFLVRITEGPRELNMN